MNQSDGHSVVLDTLGESVCSDSAVEFAVAFGSWVSGQATRGSDIDIAVKFADELTASERFKRRCFLSGELQHEDAPFVDVSDIESVPLDVANDAVRGTLICGDEVAFERFKAAIEAEFTRQRQDIRQQQRTVINRIAEDGLRG